MGAFRGNLDGELTLLSILKHVSFGMRIEAIKKGATPMVLPLYAWSLMKSWQETFSERDSQYATSMLRDVERGGATEVEHILGFMLNKASEANIAHRTLLLAYTHIKAFEQRRAAGRLP